MNHYGAQMMRHWKAERGPEYRQLEEPESFFAQLGQEIAELVEERARSLAGAAPPEGEGYLGRLQRLNTARLQAEGDVVREYLLPDPEPSS
ncbi:hypothetical protein ACFWGI_06400 [Streptomyces niveus]|uniref:hypothetical protein n=1 Tax=Streptomyces niveus TaxID=193462 RepID=UPI003651E443